MNIVFLNGTYLPIEEAKISPLDRGFLFGDGIYEVIPSYAGKKIGFKAHMERMNDGFKAIGLKLNWSNSQWEELCDILIEKNGGGSLGIYLQVSRGADTKRFHGFPNNVKPTIFAMALTLQTPETPDLKTAKSFALTSIEDLRWKRCQIKSTSLLGNVLHFQESHDSGAQEALLFNDKQELTEASTANIFVIKNGVIATPVKSNQILHGITRALVIDILANDGSLAVEERIVTMDEVNHADEIWITSSTKGIMPVTQLDDKPVGSGQVGRVWLAAATLYFNNKFNF